MFHQEIFLRRNLAFVCKSWTNLVKCNASISILPKDKRSRGTSTLEFSFNRYLPEVLPTCCLLCSTWICFACKSIWLYFIIWTLFLPFPILKFYAFKYDAILCYHSILCYTTFVEAVVKFSCSKISDKLIRKGNKSSFFCGAALKTRWLTFVK